MWKLPVLLFAFLCFSSLFHVKAEEPTVHWKNDEDSSLWIQEVLPLDISPGILSKSIKGKSIRLAFGGHIFGVFTPKVVKLFENCIKIALRENFQIVSDWSDANVKAPLFEEIMKVIRSADERVNFVILFDQYNTATQQAIEKAEEMKSGYYNIDIRSVS